MSTTYGYDPVGNRLSMDRNGTVTSYGYDRADRITSAGAVSYTVDAKGNLVARDADRFSYDQANRLVSATVEGTTTSYSYDGDGKRASQTVDSTTTSYVYDVNATLPLLLADEERKYVWGLTLAYTVDSSDAIAVYHTDGLGSVRAITDANAEVVQTYRTDEFGVPLDVQGTSAQPFGYTGEQSDATGLVYLRARYYDPQVGRFLSRDPLAGSLTNPLSQNRCSYVLNNPCRFTDPSGLAPNSQKWNLRTIGRIDRSGSADCLLFCSDMPSDGCTRRGRRGRSVLRDLWPIYRRNCSYVQPRTTP